MKRLLCCLVMTGLLAGCQSTNDEEQGPETAPEGMTAIPPELRGLPKTGKVSFALQVKPVLESKCLPCHCPPQGMNGFRLDSREHAFASGAAGPRIVPGNPDASLLLAFASTHQNVPVMPRVGNRLTKTESLILRQWIKEGADWPRGRAGDLFARENWLEPE